MIRSGIVLLLTIFPACAYAWTAASEERIAAKAAELAPNDLRQLIEKFDPEFRQGLRLAQEDERVDPHHYFVLTRQGRLRDRIERETAATITAVKTRRPMADVVQRLGMLAHYVTDANNPFHISNDDPRLTASKRDFEQYFERRLRKFPTVFYGVDPNFRLASYLDRTFARSARFYPLLGEEYFRYGTRRTSSDFDDRSTAFGVASICYSRSVSDLVNLYYYIWREAGGDVRSATVMRRSNLLLNGGF